MPSSAYNCAKQGGLTAGPVGPNTETRSLFGHSYDLLIDGESKKSGSLFDDFEPAFNPPAEIDDAEDKKPEDWVDTAKCASPPPQVHRHEPQMRIFKPAHPMLFTIAY